MSNSVLSGCRLAGVSTCVPEKTVNNTKDFSRFSPDEVRKVVGMAGVRSRRVVSGDATSSTLCSAAAKNLMAHLNWDNSSIDCLILVTQTPDYFLPSSSCLVHQQLNLAETCSCFDVGLGCSGYPYGLWLASLMIANGGHERVLVLHGETPSMFTAPEDRSTALLFGDCGSATAVMRDTSTQPENWYYSLHTDGRGYRDLIIDSGGFKNRFDPDPRNHYLKMNGANLFNFTIKKVPSLIEKTIELSKLDKEQIDYFIFHQSNQYMMQHIIKKCALPAGKVPLTIGDYGNTGGPSVALTLALGVDWATVTDKIYVMLIGYGVGLSWGSALIAIEPGVVICHDELP